MPSGTLVGPLRLSDTAGAAGGATNATATLDEEEESATLVAVIMTGEVGGALCGALYSPVAEMEPTAAFPFAVPFTLQVTA